MSEAAHVTVESALQDRGSSTTSSVSIGQRAGDNASEVIMRKLGMTLERETAYPVHGFPLHAINIDLSEFRA